MNSAQRMALAASLAAAIAIPAEGIRQWAYFDPPGILTVCYGSTSNVVKGKKYSLEECKSRLDADMLNAINIVERCVPGLPALVLAAFADAVYNMGGTIACSSTASKYLKAGNLVAACNQLPRWVYAKVAGINIKLPGLIKRRAAERELCLKDLV